MVKIKTGEISDTFYTLRFFALLAIVLAHSTYEQIPNDFAVKILNSFARCGVGMFFIASGYYFNQKKYPNVFKMLKSKIILIVIPWLIWGMVTYCTKFRTLELYFNPVEITNWILGCGTYLWFLTVLMFLYCIFQVIPNNKWMLWGSIIITLVSTLLTANNVDPFRVLRVDDKALVFTYLDAYLNVFNWIGFFSIGMLLKKHNTLNKYGAIVLGKKKWLVLFLLPILFLMIILEKSPSYWTCFSIFIELAYFILILVLSINIRNIKILGEIGKVSLPIYLLHTLFEGFIFNKILPQSIIFGVLRPIISVFCIYYLLQLGLYVSKKIHLEKGYKIIIGLK